ncbi:hypothetical protein ACGH2B_18245 [Streptomyces sp. BBFR2]|uniref:hypothetical protein n=1 Tax=Streptomyces sp. BBFR2 TaxID=3372854 RepID=UPI0037D9F964
MRTEIRRSPLLRWSPAIAAVYWGILYFLLDSWRGLWPETSSAVTQPVVVFLVAGAMAAAHRGYTASTSERDDVFTAHARPAWHLDLTRITALLAGTVGLYAVSALVPLVDTAISHPPGSPSLSMWAASALSLIAVVGVAYTAGRLIPTRFTALAAAVFCYLLISLLPQYSALGFWIPSVAVVDQEVSLSALALKALLAVAGFTVACCASAVRTLVPGLPGRNTESGSRDAGSGSRKSGNGAEHTGNTGNGLPRTAFAASAVILVVGVLVGGGMPLTQARIPDGSNVTCTASGTSRICFWADHATYLPAMRPRIEKVEAVTREIAPQGVTYAEKGIRGEGTGIEVGYGGTAVWSGLIDEALPPFRDCADETERQLEKRVAASALTSAWVEAKVRGGSLRDHYVYTGFDPTKQVEKVLKQPEADQKAQAARWVKTISAPCGKA